VSPVRVQRYLTWSCELIREQCRKYKLPNQQNGQVYLTSHRICYVDKADPRKLSVALDLKDVERYEHYVGCPGMSEEDTWLIYSLSGGLSQVFCEDHFDTEANEKGIVAWPITGCWTSTVEECQ